MTAPKYGSQNAQEPKAPKTVRMEARTAPLTPEAFSWKPDPFYRTLFPLFGSLTPVSSAGEALIMISDQEFSRTLVFSVLRALQGEVSAELMGVLVRWKAKEVVLETCYVDFPSPAEIEAMQVVCTEVSADLWEGYSADPKIRVRGEWPNKEEWPKPGVSHGFWALMRREMRDEYRRQA